MTRPTRFAACSLLLSLSLVAGLAEAAKPNFVIIFADDQGYGDLSCHGNPILKTPHLDRLHAESVRFTDFHVSPFCTPTRAAFMTGRYAVRLGMAETTVDIDGSGMAGKEVTLAEMLSDSGYNTIHIGKWIVNVSKDMAMMSRPM